MLTIRLYFSKMQSRPPDLVNFMLDMMDVFGRLQGYLTGSPDNGHIRVTYRSNCSPARQYDQYEALTSEGELWLLTNLPPDAEVITLT